MGIRSSERPFVFREGSLECRVGKLPGESNSYLFGGNSNWRGPVWLPINDLIIEALERYAHLYPPDLTVEYPTGPEVMMTRAWWPLSCLAATAAFFSRMPMEIAPVTEERLVMRRIHTGKSWFSFTNTSRVKLAVGAEPVIRQAGRLSLFDASKPLAQRSFLSIEKPDIQSSLFWRSNTLAIEPYVNGNAGTNERLMSVALALILNGLVDLQKKVIQGLSKQMQRLHVMQSPWQ